MSAAGTGRKQIALELELRGAEIPDKIVRVGSLLYRLALGQMNTVQQRSARQDPNVLVRLRQRADQLVIAAGDLSRPAYERVKSGRYPKDGGASLFSAFTAAVDHLRYRGSKASPTAPVELTADGGRAAP